MLRLLGDAFASAARPSKGGFVRDALTAQFPRLVSLLEGAFGRITTESKLKVRATSHALRFRDMLLCTPVLHASVHCVAAAALRARRNASAITLSPACMLHLLCAACAACPGRQGVPPAAQPEQLASLLDAAAPFRDAYLAAALGRMQDVVGAAFPGSARALPSPADVQKCIR